ncbi:hypothetical protein N0V90_011621 [Kalmusia sp. IMI 367209]|nr:hypothetical protein N0V90_011621 [Kalmusia sp. IMI 367209]
MIFRLIHAALLTAWLPSTLATPNPPFDLNSFTSQNTITRDVAIIGGGSAGTYSSISLKDKGKTVIVVEKKARIGGHTETYIDPATGTPIDYGVYIFHNLTIVRDYFARFKVPLIISGSDADPNATSESAYYDLRTGRQVQVASPNQTAVGEAFAKYTQFLQKHPRLNDGMFLPNPVPEDLVLPFGEFAKKYGIEAAIPTMFNYNPGLGDILTVPTIEQIRVFGLSLMQQFQGGFLTTKHHNNSEIYSHAQAELLAAKSLLLRSEVVYADRSDSGVTLVVTTPEGLKLIKAKKLIITIPPRLDFLRPFDLSRQESSIFCKLIDAGYYSAILNNTGLPANLDITNALQNSPYNLPELPAVYSFSSTPVPDLKHAYYGTPRSNLTYPVSDTKVQSDIQDALTTLQKANPSTFNQTKPYFVVYSSHTPFYLQAKPEDTKAGFYGKMYALQGLRNTYWTGGAWRAQDSSDIWRYTEEEVLPKLLKGL